MIGTIEIVMRKIEGAGKVSETVLLSLPNEKSMAINQASDILFFTDLKIYLKEQVIYRSGKLIQLSNQEFLTFRFLAEHPGWVCTKEEIYNAVYGNETVGNIDNSIYCLVSSLRKKLEIDSHHPKYIKTIRGVGYKFVIPRD